MGAKNNKSDKGKSSATGPPAKDRFKTSKQLKQQIKDVKSKINLYKNWHLGSPHQQRSRKKSFDKNTERLPIIEGYLNLVKRMLKEYE